MCVSEHLTHACVSTRTRRYVCRRHGCCSYRAGGRGRGEESHESGGGGERFVGMNRLFPLSPTFLVVAQLCECLSLSLLLVLPDHVNPTASGNGDCRPEKFRPTLSLLFVHREREMGSGTSALVCPGTCPHEVSGSGGELSPFPSLCPRFLLLLYPPRPLIGDKLSAGCGGERGWILTKPYRQQLRESDLPGDTHTHSTHPVSHSPV